MMWPKLDHFFEVVESMGTPRAALAIKLESVLSVDLITEILTTDKVALPKEFTGMYWSVMADPFACNDMDEEVMSGQGLVGQAVIGAITLGAVYDS